MTPSISFATVVLVFILSALRLAAQVASPHWRKPNITTPTAARASLAGAAIDEGIAMLNTAGQFDGDPDISMAGGTFWTTDAANPYIDALGTGSFLVLSALLAEATSDQMYLDAATQTADFVHAHLYNINNLVQDSISSRANDSCAVNEVVMPYNSGLMIHGLGILTDITGNATMQDLLSDILLATIPNTAWQNPDGIVGGKSRASPGPWSRALPKFHNSRLAGLHRELSRSPIQRRY
ncbi:Glycoside hydrolase family 76 protein [Mycena venus]|uniref:Glycoside hydrolase family 76 protein n=1 Tax=Mycena venus TaxID=2733690 RepID=A0A8H6X3X5_9AGAR|nr:Glycoside hydrolase family 76 protein [Mycena venus]